jgi:hypothetical protein
VGGGANSSSKAFGISFADRPKAKKLYKIVTGKFGQSYYPNSPQIKA